LHSLSLFRPPRLPLLSSCAPTWLILLTCSMNFRYIFGVLTPSLDPQYTLSTTCAPPRSTPQPRTFGSAGIGEWSLLISSPIYVRDFLFYLAKGRVFGLYIEGARCRRAGKTQVFPVAPWYFYNTAHHAVLLCARTFVHRLPAR
jgi:hypothetical protein